MSIITRSKAKEIEKLNNENNLLITFINKTLTCRGCSQLFKNPVTLPCGHSFCVGCLPTPKDYNSCPLSECSKPNHLRTYNIDISLSKITNIFTCMMEQQPLQSSDNLMYSFSGSSAFSYEQSDCNSSILGQIQPELECQLCLMHFLEPVTACCGHTLCKQCFVRTLDYNDKCPVCRTKLPSYSNCLGQPSNLVLNTLVRELFPHVMIQRQLALKNELVNQVEETPLFVCSLVFPKMPCYLHIFEPRYRLMIRRILESPRQRFGMVLHKNQAVGFHEYGTMLEARNVDMLPDGRYLLDAVGSFRFRILERGVRDGYNVGKIERITDDEEEEDETSSMDSTQSPESDNPQLPTIQSNPYLLDPSSLTIPQMQAECIRFVEALKSSSAPWLFQRLDSTVGPMPTDPADFTFWLASIIPLEEQEKYELLPITSVRKRFLVLHSWIKRLSEQWWFDRLCSVM